MFIKGDYLKEAFNYSLANYLPQPVELLTILQVMQKRLDHISKHMTEV